MKASYSYIYFCQGPKRNETSDVSNFFFYSLRPLNWLAGECVLLGKLHLLLPCFHLAEGSLPHTRLMELWAVLSTVCCLIHRQPSNRPVRRKEAFDFLWISFWMLAYNSWSHSFICLSAPVNLLVARMKIPILYPLKKSIYLLLPPTSFFPVNTLCSTTSVHTNMVLPVNQLVRKWIRCSIIWELEGALRSSCS